VNLSIYYGKSWIEGTCTKSTETKAEGKDSGSACALSPDVRPCQVCRSRLCLNNRIRTMIWGHWSMEEAGSGHEDSSHNILTLDALQVLSRSPGSLGCQCPCGYGRYERSTYIHIHVHLLLQGSIKALCTVSRPYCV
jgi:hypothetical protein